MPHHRSEALVTEFLRDALAVDALGVPELEARARVPGLLSEHQRITHSKVFKSAKKFLEPRMEGRAYSPLVNSRSPPRIPQRYAGRSRRRRDRHLGSQVIGVVNLAERVENWGPPCLRSPICRSLPPWCHGAAQYCG
jgi:hypothetical protein